MSAQAAPTTGRTHAPEVRRALIGVTVLAPDPLLRTGLLSELRNRPGIEVLDDAGRADVVVAAARSGLRDVLTSSRRLVLIADDVRQDDLWAAIENGLTILLPLAEATPARLLRAISEAHRGHARLPPAHLERLLRSLSQLHKNVLAPRDLTLSGLTRRETDVLRLLADGLDTAEIALMLAFSERTVKNVLHSMLTRLGLRNRVHAVAHGIRNGII
ncbi:DNA-binding response regulator [Amycolatopsis balhimycina DSM 5908]|uniref:DNA-binding response regulator n=1 Tax=Amycolatopsis balhimycina DSM 5908 TaxID=1081091 RepID=A0A428WP47_AMYBA|nr:response regulator transcription factor [Amycolatopsis balhimycina]RSM44851.1 DNA-binding response regulator [Amycolatopsis balhimycina DSM 5908]